MQVDSSNRNDSLNNVMTVTLISIIIFNYITLVLPPSSPVAMFVFHLLRDEAKNHDAHLLDINVEIRNVPELGYAVYC